MGNSKYYKRTVEKTAMILVFVFDTGFLCILDNISGGFHLLVLRKTQPIECPTVPITIATISARDENTEFCKINPRTETEAVIQIKI